MACHVKYFNEAGAFDSRGYVRYMGINLEFQCIGDTPLSPEERAMITRAILLSDNDTKIGSIGGIVHLIGHVQQLLDNHHQQHYQTHTPQSIVLELLMHPDIARQYSLHCFFRQNLDP